MGNLPTNEPIGFFLNFHNLINKYFGFDDMMKGIIPQDVTINENIFDSKDFGEFGSEQEQAEFIESIPELSDETKAIIAKISFAPKEQGSIFKEKFSLITGLYHWGKTKIVYEFNKEISNSIMESMDDIGDMTFSCLEFLPVNAFFIKLPSLPMLDGMRSYIENESFFGEDKPFGNLSGVSTLEGVLCYYDRSSKNLFYTMLQKGTAEQEAKLIASGSVLGKRFVNVPIKDMLSENNSPTAYFYKKDFCRILPFLLYLTAENAEIPPIPEISQKLATRLPTKKNIQQLEVGRKYRIRRRKFRQKYQSSKGSGGKRGMKAPHVRRAHYTHCWYGKRDSDQRERRLKWIPETYVHQEQILDIKPVIVNMDSK